MIKFWVPVFFIFFQFPLLGFQIPINTPEKKFRPILSADGQVMIFNREGYFLNHGTSNLSDIWMLEKLPSGQWRTANQLGGAINDEAENEILQMDFSGHFALIKSEGKIYRIAKKGNIWEETEKVVFPFKFEDIFIVDREGVAFFTNDGDLFFAVKNSSGPWELPQKLNFQVEAKRSEKHPFLAPDGRTLFFSSNSFGGFGGMDVFVSRRIGDGWENWTVPQNIGASVNTNRDELYPFVQWNGESIWFTRSFSETESEIFSTSLAEQYRPEPLIYFVAKDCPGEALLISAEGGEILNSFQDQGVLQSVIMGGQPLLVRFPDLENSFVPLSMIEGNQALMEELDYDASGIYEAFMNDPEYKNSEQRFQAIQKEILDIENQIFELSTWLNRYVSELKPPVTRLIETTGFRTDKTLQAIELAYYQKIGIDLRSDTLSRDWTPKNPSREERLSTLKEGMFSEINPNPIDSSILTPRSFNEIRERTRRSLEAELMEQVWTEAFQNNIRAAKESVRKFFNKEEFRNVIKTVGEIDTLFGGWWPEFPKYFPGVLEFPDIENRLKDHIRPQVIQSMAGMMKDQIEEYASKLFQLDIFLKHRETILTKIEASNQGLKQIEQKTDFPLIQASKEINPEGTKVKEVQIFPKSYPLVKGQSFELETVVFSSNSFLLTQWAKFELDRIADILFKHPNLNFTIRVHTHPQMSVTFADELTGQRAEEIKKYFAERGIEDSRLKVIGFGKRNPLVLSQNQASKIKNQRVELFIDKS